MNEFTLIRKNLGRKTTRSVLMVICIFVAFFIFGVLGSMFYALNFVNLPGGEDRLVTVSKLGFGQPLPIAMLRRIREVDGVRDASFKIWLASYVGETRRVFRAAAVEPQPFLNIYGEDFTLGSAAQEAFLRERTGILVGRTLADKYGVVEGQRLRLQSRLYQNKSTGRNTWEFLIVGVFDAKRPGVSTDNAYFHYDYLRESIEHGGDFVMMIDVQTEAADQNDRVAARIDRTFLNSSTQTRTRDATVFGREFIAQFGDISRVITLTIGAGFFAIILIVANTFSIAIRERTREIAVLKAIGFTDRRLLQMILVESLTLWLTGALAGLGVALLASSAISNALQGAFSGTEVALWVAAAGVVLAIVCATVIGISPAMRAYNLKVVEGLERRQGT